MASSRLQLISKKLIKPFFSTPPPQRHYKLSIHDQLIAPWYLPMAFFFQNQSHSQSSDTNSTHISGLLENSLSKVLTSYYPFAGRLIDNMGVDCDDRGATLLEARVNCRMSEILQQPHLNAMDMVFPDGVPWRSEYNDSLLVAQISHFDCGGKALSVCLSHTIGEVQTLSNFISDWAAIANRSGKIPSPQFNASSIFPPDPLIKPTVGFLEGHNNVVTRRFSFDGSKLNQLKAKAAAESGVENPTRVEVATALLHKSAMAAASTAEAQSFKPSVLMQTVNIRPLISPPLSPNCVGNLVHIIVTPIIEERDLSFPRLVSELRRRKVEFYDKFRGIKAEEFMRIKRETIDASRTIGFDVRTFSSLCKYPLYDVDFGFGRPIRVSFPPMPSRSFSVLTDDKNGDGIEAFIPMEEKLMPAFESDPDILKFAS